MRTPTLTRPAMLIMGVLLTACGAETSPTAENAPALSADATQANVSVSLTFHEPEIPELKGGDCPVAATGFCGSGEVIPFGIATETIAFGAACGGACDLRTITLPQGTLVLEETFSNPACPGSCGTLTDVIVEGTGLFQGATGVLSGRVRQAGRQSTVKLSGTIALAS